MIPEEKVDEVRHATDLVDLISRYIPLRRSGSGFKAACPFHEEKTPSFHVWPETQTWKCFGCGKGGSAFHFLMERERMTFPEAVRALARDVAIEIEPASPEEQRGRADREKLYEILEWTCRFFESRLRAPEGRAAVEYCRSRGIEGATAKRFRIGFAPPGWRNLADAAGRKNIPESLLSLAGLLREGNREPYDWFRDRLMFPIGDVQGRVIGFGGRALDDSEPKYLNSPDTPLFKKGRTLYALDVARDEVLKERRIGLVEGYTDVLMAHQHGVDWIVAALGTGLTREHAVLVKRYADRVDLIYDADTAGVRAAERALDVFLEFEADVRVTELPGGQDPCDFLLSKGREEFLGSVEEGREVFEFLVSRAGDKHDLETLTGRIAAVDDVLASVARTQNEVKRDLLLMRVAERFQVPEASVRERLKVFAGRREGFETGPGFAPPEWEEAPAERLVVEAVVFRPALAERLREAWPPDRFRHPLYREIARRAIELFGGNGPVDPSMLVARLEDASAAETLAGILEEGKDKKDFEKQFTDCVERLRRDARLSETRAAIERAKSRGDEEERRELERELFRLRGRRR
ncbi:MAG: DNA primase [Planctomycetota bacterium]